jgi:hypothetical protein
MINKKIELTFIMPEMTPENRAAIKKQIAELPVNSRHFLLQKTKEHLFMKNTRNYFLPAFFLARRPTPTSEAPFQTVLAELQGFPCWPLERKTKEIANAPLENFPKGQKNQAAHCAPKR